MILLTLWLSLYASVAENTRVWQAIRPSCRVGLREPFFGLSAGFPAHSWPCQKVRVSVCRRPSCSGHSILAPASHMCLHCLTVLPLGSCDNYTSFSICFLSPRPKLARQVVPGLFYTAACEQSTLRWALFLRSFVYWRFYFATWKLNVFNWKDLRDWKNFSLFLGVSCSKTGNNRWNAFGKGMSFL